MLKIKTDQVLSPQISQMSISAICEICGQHYPNQKTPQAGLFVAGFKGYYQFFFP